MTILNKKIKLFNINDVKVAFDEAKITKRDLINPISQELTISEILSNGKITILEDNKKLKNHKILLKNHENYPKKIFAYDESIQKFPKLQGTMVFTSHSLVEVEKKDYDYTCLISPCFLTRAKKYEKIKIAIVDEEPEIAYKRKLREERDQFILENIEPGSILFIDGPFMGQQQSYENRKFVEKLNNIDVMTIFYVKNSYSRMLIDNLAGNLKHDFNSDLDYVNCALKIGERTSYTLYEEVDSSGNNKVTDSKKIFGYIKCYDNLPQRFEFHIETFKKYQESIDSVMELIYYFSVLNGEPDNPQLRPIAIAERYAKESLKYISPAELTDSYGLDDTMNAARGYE